MACKLRKAIGAVKDQTSISLAKVSNAANLEVNILKATTHDEIPMESRYVNEIAQLVSSNKVYAAVCAQSLGKRIGKTHNWVVALKCLTLVLRIFQDGDPYFPREVFHAMKRGAKILNLSSFKDDSTSNSWDYTAFVRTFALYLDERLDCFLTGKLQRRFTYHHNRVHKNLRDSKIYIDSGIKDMKPTMVLDRITHWQKLLDRAIGTRPTGLAKKNGLVQISLYAIVQESFDLYKDISDGLVVILDSFFELPYRACAIAFKACVKSSKQFDELSAFYNLCAGLGVGRTSEYPSVQKVSDELMETLQEFLKDKASYLEDNCQSPISNSKHKLHPPPPKTPPPSLGQEEADKQSVTPKRSLKGEIDQYGFQCKSLKNLTVTTSEIVESPVEIVESPVSSIEQEFFSLHSEQDQKQSQNDDFVGKDNFGSTSSLPNGQTSSSFDMVSFDDFQQVEQQDNQTRALKQQNADLGSNSGSNNCWDLVLADLSPKPEQTSSSFDMVSFDDFQQVEQHNSQTRASKQQNADLGSNNGSNNCWDLVLADLSPEPEQDSPNKLSHKTVPSILDTLVDQPSSVPQPQFNPFLENIATVSPSTTKNYRTHLNDLFYMAPTFQAVTPTFCAQNPCEATKVPTFTGQSSNSETSLALTLGDLNGLTIEPTFRAQASLKTNTVTGPIFHAQDLDKITAEPAFHATSSYEIGSSSPTFHAQNSNKTSISPTFSTQNINMAVTVPTLAPQNQNANETMRPSTFWAQF